MAERAAADTDTGQEETTASILDRTWRFIPFAKYDPIQLIALSDVALNQVSGSGTPIVWLYCTDQNAVSVSPRQKVSEAVSITECNRLKVKITRRTGDGGALYLDTAGELSWAIIMPSELLPKDRQPAEYYGERIAQALEQLGIEAYFKPPNDIQTTLGKIGTISVRKERYATLVSGTILYAVNTAIMQSVLTPENDTQRERHIPERLKQITSVSLEAEKSKEETMQAIAESLLDRVTFKSDKWSSKELAEADTLAAKYASKEWLRLE